VYSLLDALFWKISLNGFRPVKAQAVNSVIPAWRAGIQVDMDVSGRILRTWMLAIHAGMTASDFSLSVGERKLMNHFVVRPNCLFEIAVAHG